MKAMKKIAMMLLCICLAVPCFGMVTLADNNAIRFNDPKTKTGEEFEVSGYIETTSAVSGIKVVFAYDTSYLKFVSGNGITETSAGKLEYTNTNSYASLPATGRLVFSMKFQALKEGTTKVTIAGVDIESTVASWKQGNSTIKIEKGEEVVTTPETTTPETTDPETTTPETTDPETTTPETTDPETTTPETAEPDTEDEVSAQELMISNQTSISLLTDVSEIILPEQYVETTVVVGGEDYPAWQDSNNSEFYIIYASSSTGVTSLYQYDVLENTYQRFSVPAEIEDDATILDSIEEMFGDNTEYVIIGAGAVLLIFIILIIVLSVKLHNRNAELDELYDEYGIDLEDEEAKETEPKEEIKETVEVRDTEEHVVLDTEDDVVADTEDDIVLETEEEETSDNTEAVDAEKGADEDVEFYVKETIKEFFEEPEEQATDSVEEALTSVEDTKEMEEKPAEEAEEEFFDEEDEFFDELKNNFKVDFIDLDD